MSLRSQSVARNHETRPLPRDNKKFGLLKRWASSVIAFRKHHTQSSNTSSSNHQFSSHTHRNSASSVVTTSSCNSLDIISTKSSNTTEASNKIDNNQKPYNSIAIPNNEEIVAPTMAHRESYPDYLPLAVTSSPDPLNIMHWMQNDCPKDVVLLVLAFAGPQKIATVGRTNRFWRQVIEQESTWRLLCESLYKWKDGDCLPSSWKKYYQHNPCVPVDYSDIHTALSEVIRNAKEDSTKPTAIRVLLRPGRYVLRKAITMEETISNNHSVSVAIETMACSPGNCYNSDFTPPYQPSDQSKKKRKNKIKKFFGCATIDVESGEDEVEYLDDDDINDFIDRTQSRRPNVGLRDTSLLSDVSYSRKKYINSANNRATLVLKTKRQNEPLFRLRRGSFAIRNIDLKHGSLGEDLWNGNSAIHIQPTLEPDGDSIEESAPTVTLDSVAITSSSGRGVVNVDGGHVKIRNSYIHDCAATGIYIGGSGSRATIEHSDVISNGKGNRRNRRGIAAGHSGIYLEQGHASIIDCNVSRNSLTGVSAISRDNSLLNLQDSDLVSNGTFQLEMPDLRSAAYMNSVTVNNNFASDGTGRYRSEFFVE